MYYVSPHSPNPDCPSGEPCLTINEYAQGNHFDGDDNITLFFLNGEHNLTAQNFEIVNKTALEMVPSQVHKEVRIYVSSETHIRIQNISTVEIMVVQLAFEWNYLSESLLFLDLDILLLTKVSIESCQLTILGAPNTAITELTASNSCVHLRLDNNNHIVAVRKSEFHSSILNVSSIVTGRVYSTNIVISALSLEHSLMEN